MSDLSIDKLIKLFRASLTEASPAYCSPSLDLCLDETVIAALQAKPVFGLPFWAPKSDCYVGWGRRSGKHALKMAKARGAKALLLEDGFMRSYGRADPSCSIVLDDLGIYYDAGHPSRLEKLIAEPLSEAQIDRIESILQSWRLHKLSKYNAGEEYSGPLPDKYVLVIDQVFNDASVRYGMGDASAFDAMLKAAQEENPDATVVVKVHPDVFTRSKAGHFDIKKLKDLKAVEIIAEACLPTRLIAQAHKIYTVTSQIGFEALMWGKTVRCFGMPFYAGWGLTQDNLPAPGRRGTATLNQLAWAALIAYPRYVDPVSKKPCEVESVVDYLSQLKQKA